MSDDPFREARQLLLDHRTNAASAVRDFRWPELDAFNWALDWFDVFARSNDHPALWVENDAGTVARLSFREMSERSDRVAGFLRARGVGRGDRMLLMLPNAVPIWETMLAAMKLGAVVIPATLLLSEDDLRDRLVRGNVQFEPDGPTRATDPLLLYFTSGTTSEPKLVLHSHQSYPVGHLSTMYWIGLQEGNVHLNVSSPGWAKHAWSSYRQRG